MAMGIACDVDRSSLRFALFGNVLCDVFPLQSGHESRGLCERFVHSESVESFRPLPAEVVLLERFAGDIQFREEPKQPTVTPPGAIEALNKHARRRSSRCRQNRAADRIIPISDIFGETYGKGKRHRRSR